MISCSYMHITMCEIAAIVSINILYTTASYIIEMYLQVGCFIKVVVLKK